MKKTNETAQAGLEYLMTYGWALVLVVTVVAVLFFVFGTPASTTRFSSSDPTKILLRTGNVSGSNAEVQLQNATGGKIEINTITPTNYSNCTINGGTSSISVGGGSIMKLNCTAPSDGKGSIKIEYTDYAGLQRSVAINASGTSTSGGSGNECSNGICSLSEACSADCFAEAYCSDGINNDQDSSTDCADADCFADPACNSAALAAEYLFDEGSGPTVADSSGNGNNGTITGATWQATDCPSGSCLHFNAPDFVRVSDSPSLRVADDFSISLWAKLDVVSGNVQEFAWKRMAFPGFSFYVNNAGKLVLRLGNAGSFTDFVCDSCTISSGTWHNVAVTNDASNGIRFYVDGNLKQSFVFYDWVDFAGPMYIGFGFVGFMDNLRIYDASIS